MTGVVVGRAMGKTKGLFAQQTESKQKRPASQWVAIVSARIGTSFTTHQFSHSLMTGALCLLQYIAAAHSDLTRRLSNQDI